MLDLTHLEAYVVDELEVFGVHPEVLHDAGVVHVVRVFSRDREITVAHLLLGGIDDDRVIDTGSIWLWVLLWTSS